MENDPFDLERFVRAQAGDYPEALSEIRAGRKTSHWMWYIFPQFKGLGHSSMAVRYSIKSPEEARAYLDHPVLGRRLAECAEAVLAVEGRTASEIFGFPDDMKLKSSMTLFERAAGEEDSLFAHVLDRYFQGERDRRTLDLIGK
ncbi:MAG: DUF1810 domain-containing protein [Acidobacteria bacterium]|nr:DUF1810 domain-containing protein [Acidobacteriota bacterium]